MLEGLDSGEVITGGYVDGDGGQCPMLAAHRNGGRADEGTDTFARAWDEFTGTPTGQPRKATEREVSLLRYYLECSLIDDAGQERPLAEEVADVQAARRQHAESVAREEAAESVDDVLARTYAAAAERRAERRADFLLASEPAEETPLGAERDETAPPITVRRRPPRD